jgi:hypothetical protein
MGKIFCGGKSVVSGICPDIRRLQLASGDLRWCFTSFPNHLFPLWSALDSLGHREAQAALPRREIAAHLPAW